MARAVQPISGDYWRPANEEAERHARPFLFENVCSRCGMDYAVGARYCYICGNRRYAQPEPAAASADSDWWKQFRQRSGLSGPSLSLLAAGVTCLLVALVLGVLLPSQSDDAARSLQDVRLDWLLGAVAAMLGGLLLKYKAT